ncbi:MAG: DUF2933 domain-containing protein [Rhodocyclaceae bacterium]
MHHDHAQHTPLVRRKGVLMLMAVLAFAAIYAISEHREHVSKALPYLMLLLCPIMHLFMHRGHAAAKHDATEHRQTPPHA